MISQEKFFITVNRKNILYTNTLVKNVKYTDINIPKPILKWVGGKTQIIDKLIIEFPTTMNNYRETFLGGGSVLITLLSFVNAGVIKISGKIYAYDLNEVLIHMYKNIQSNHNSLFTKLNEIIKEFNSCGDGEINRKPNNLTEAKVARENYFYWTRMQRSEEHTSELPSRV
jgi:DNA adenine methylase